MVHLIIIMDMRHHLTARYEQQYDKQYKNIDHKYR